MLIIVIITIITITVGWSLSISRLSRLLGRLVSGSSPARSLARVAKVFHSHQFSCRESSFSSSLSSRPLSHLLTIPPSHRPTVPPGKPRLLTRILQPSPNSPPLFACRLARFSPFSLGNPSPAISLHPRKITPIQSSLHPSYADPVRVCRPRGFCGCGIRHVRLWNHLYLSCACSYCSYYSCC